MASNVKVSADQLASTINQILTKYGDEANSAIIRAGRKTSKETAKDVNAAASSVIHGRRGKYEKSWKSQFKEQRLGFEAVVYSTQPGLPHLLEHGHFIKYLGGVKSKGSGHARAIPHIAQVDEQVPDKLEKAIRVEVEKL